jgi:uncharacterized protein YfaP (DUF2135 family)
MGQLWSKRSLAVAALAISALSGCTASLKPNTDSSITTFISGVTDASGTVHAVLVDGDAPQASGGPTSTVATQAIMINGGSSQQAVNGGATFDRVIVSVPGLNDYYELTLPAGVSAENIVVTASPDAYAGRLTFNYAVASGTSVGPYATQAVRFLRVGTGDIQISVAWTDSADVDLHVIDPNGEEIYFGHRNAVSGGTLDLDANAACTKNTFTDGSPAAYVSNENVVWPTGKAIAGTYKVVLDYWSECGTARTDWVVTVAHVGATPQIFTGSFVGASSGVPDDTVTVFTQ